MSSNSGKEIFYLAGGCIAGLFVIYSGLKRYLLVQKIKNTPTSKTEAAAIGLVELAGVAKCAEANESPISKTKCAYWKINAEYYQSGKHGGWKTIYKTESGSEFYLEDDTGRILVDSRGADFDIPPDNTYTGYISGKGVMGIEHKKLDEPALRFIETLDEATKKKFMDLQHMEVRVFEHYLVEGDPVYVLGSAEPRDGVSSKVGAENLVVRKGNVDKTMFIRDSGEKTIVEKLSGSMYWQIFGGLALSAICLFLLILDLGWRFNWK